MCLRFQTEWDSDSSLNCLLLLLRALDADGLLDVSVRLVLQHEVGRSVFGQDWGLQRVFLLILKASLKTWLLAYTPEGFVLFHTLRVLQARFTTLIMTYTWHIHILAERELFLTAMLITLLLSGVSWWGSSVLTALIDWRWILDMVMLNGSIDVLLRWVSVVTHLSSLIKSRSLVRLLIERFWPINLL